MSVSSKQDIKIKHKNHLPIEITNWRVKVGDQVKKDEHMGQYEYIVENDDGSTEQLAHPISASTLGQIVALKPLHTIIETMDEPLGVIIEPCSHSVQVMGLCALCGKDIHTAY